MKYSAEKAFPYLISILFLFPLFKENILTFLVVLLVVNTIVYLFQKKEFKPPKKEFLMLTIPFFIVFFVSIIRFHDLNSLKPVKSALFFLILPIAFNYIPLSNFTTNSIYKYITILKNACFFIIVCYLFSFFYNYTIYDFFIVANRVSLFRNYIYNEIPFFKIHPAYFTSILVFCTAFSLKEMLQKKKWLEFIYIFFFILITFLLITKINIIFMACVILVFILFQLKGYFIHKIISICLLFALISFLIKNTPGLHERFYELSISLTKPPKKMSFDSTNIRVAIYNCDIELVKENFWIGVGFNTIKDKIEECLISKYDSAFYNNHQYLSHNYFLYMLISGGIFSLLLFLFYLFNVFKIVLKSNKFIFYIFFTNVLLMCMIEDFLYRVYGLFFFNLIVLIFVKNIAFIHKYNQKDSYKEL
jgi:O-antigen ligase